MRELFASAIRRWTKTCTTESEFGVRRLPIERRCFRVVVLGGAGVGKTSLIRRFLFRTVRLAYVPTVEDLYSTQLEVDSEVQQVEILDTTGFYYFPAMRKLAIERGDAFLLVYDVSNPQTLETVRRLGDEIREVKGDDTDVPIVVTGNKADLVNVGQTDGSDVVVTECVVCLDWGFDHVITSAAADTNVTEVFYRLGKLKTVRKTKPMRRTKSPKLSGFKWCT